jgi:hypothetical protein
MREAITTMVTTRSIANAGSSGRSAIHAMKVATPAPSATSVRMNERGAIGESLGARAGRPRLLDEPHDDGERGPFAGAGDLEAK